MRMGFGLLSLLLVVALMFYLFSETSLKTAEKGHQIQQEMAPVTGRGTDGKSASDSVTLDPKMRGSELTGLVVSDMVPGGYFDTYFHLAKGDEIQKIGDDPVSMYGDYQIATSMVAEAGTRQKALTILRGGQKYILTANGKPTLDPSSPPAAVATPATPAADGSTPAAAADVSTPAATPPAAAPAKPPVDTVGGDTQIPNLTKGIHIPGL